MSIYECLCGFYALSAVTLLRNKVTFIPKNGFNILSTLFTHSFSRRHAINITHVLMRKTPITWVGSYRQSLLKSV